MEIEKLKKSHKKEMIIGGLIGVSILSVLIFATTKAKYRTAESINIAKGTINYKPYDFKIMAMYEQNSNGTYTEVTTMSDAKKYKINESKSYCTKDNVNKDTYVVLKTENGKHLLNNLTKTDKCYLYFDKIKVTNISELIASKTIAVRENFQTLTENTTGTMYASYDNDGITYYYAGAVDDNWVKFAGFYWRIIRFNGDGTIRLIYNGTEATQTGETTQIGTSKFNEKNGDNAYVGYMYGTPGSDTYEETHANTNSSTIKIVVDNWYKTNIVEKGYSNKVDASAGFCGDREPSTINGSSGIGTATTYYIGYMRFVTGGRWNASPIPTLKCKNVSDLYTASGASKGNKALTYPVGLITVDEVNVAGAAGATGNSNYYLYTNQVYWTMSPYVLDANGYAGMFIVYNNGRPYNSSVSSLYGIRPVINLKADTIFSSGDGTTSNPYVVE